MTLSHCLELDRYSRVLNCMNPARRNRKRENSYIILRTVALWQILSFLACTPSSLRFYKRLNSELLLGRRIAYALCLRVQKPYLYCYKSELAVLSIQLPQPICPPSGGEPHGVQSPAIFARIVICYEQWVKQYVALTSGHAWKKRSFFIFFYGCEVFFPRHEALIEDKRRYMAFFIYRFETGTLQTNCTLYWLCALYQCYSRRSRKDCTDCNQQNMRCHFQRILLPKVVKKEMIDLLVIWQFSVVKND